MADGLNMTYITLDGHVAVNRYRYLYFMIMFVVYILIILCNATIICLIWIHRNLHEPMYIFIAALLLNSLMFSTVIYPKLLIDFLSEKQIISVQACFFQFYMFYSLSCSEVLLLAAMSYDRYVSICKPLQYPIIMTKTTVGTCLVLAWIFPACLVSVPVVFNVNNICSFTLKGIFCNSSLHDLYCVQAGALTIVSVIALFIVLFLPVLFILFTYTKILIIAYQSSGEVRKKAAQTCLPHLLVMINYSCLLTFDITIVRLDSDFPKTVRLVMTLQIITYNPLCNPIIYGLKMKEISKHLKRLFCRAKAN